MKKIRDHDNPIARLSFFHHIITINHAQRHRSNGVLNDKKPLCDVII